VEVVLGVGDSEDLGEACQVAEGRAALGNVVAKILNYLLTRQKTSNAHMNLYWVIKNAKRALF